VDILVRHPLAEFLRECGYRVVEASNADEARQLLGGDLPSVDIDIVLADASGAGEVGFALAVWTRENHPGVEVILAGSVTGAAEKAGEICKEGPALTKPYDHKLVVERIHRLVAARDRRRRGGQEAPPS
jgi:DNA-binding response OmpR family regulator